MNSTIYHWSNWERCMLDEDPFADNYDERVVQNRQFPHITRAKALLFGLRQDIQRLYDRWQAKLYIRLGWQCECCGAAARNRNRGMCDYCQYEDCHGPFEYGDSYPEDDE